MGEVGPSSSTPTMAGRSLSLEKVRQHLVAHPGTRPLRDLRAQLVQEGIPLDKVGPTLRRGGPPEAGLEPGEHLRAYLQWVCSSNQYDLSTGPSFVAQAALRYLAVAAEDGELRADAVEAKLGAEGRTLFEQLASELSRAESEAAEKPARRLPDNALGLDRSSPDLEPMPVPGEVMRRAKFTMRLAEPNRFQRHREALEARAARRDPVGRIARHLRGRPRKAPRVAAIEPLAARARAEQPFAGRKLIALQHLYRSTRAIFDAAMGGGMKAEDITVLGKPYSGSMRTAAEVLDAGHKLVVPSLHQSELTDHDAHMTGLVKEQLQRLLSERGPEDPPILVLDDGGHVAHTVATYFPEARSAFSYVEQTQRGASVVAKLGARVGAPVVDVAQSEAKKVLETPSIAHSVFVEATKILDRLEEQGVRVPRSMLVLGYGAVGAAAAARFRDAGFEVHVYDPDAERRAAAEADGLMAHADKATALSTGDVVMSASGTTALSLDDYAQLPKRAVLFNAASANNELSAQSALVLQMLNGSAVTGTIDIRGPQPRFPRELLFAMDTSTLDEDGRLWDVFDGRSVCLGRDDSATQIDRVVHMESGQSFYFGRAGFVVNLTDNDDPIPPHYIGLTRGLLFAGLLQAASAEEGAGLVPLDPELEAVVVAHTERDLAKRGESLERPRF